MPRPGLANQQDLLRWAQTLSAKGELPRLIRRLVLETSQGVTRVDFPAVEGTAVGGWDGIVQAGAPAPFVPQGLSLWELSAGKATTRKADEDYAKRTVTPDGSPTTAATYCALSIRRWRDRRTWATTRTSDSRWKEVLAFGLDDLETWLEASPVTHAWISELLGLEPYGLRTAGRWWESWSTATDPALTTEIVLAGRSNNAADLRQRVAGSGLTTLRGGSLDEALAFVAAVVLHDDAAGDGALVARTALVDDVATWRSLADRPQPLLLVARSPGVIAEARTAPLHHVIVPLTGVADADIELEPIDGTIATAALVAAGLDAQRCDDAGRLAHRSLLALRRNLARKPELHTPAWATTPVGRIVRGVLLAGSWNDESIGDHEQLASLTGMAYDELREELAVLAAHEDPLVTRVGNTWAVVSPFDAWRQLRRNIRPDDVQRLSGVVTAVLLEADPAFGLAPEQRWRPSIDRHVRRHSGDLRAGLVTTIALLGALGEHVDAGGGQTGELVAASLVRTLLGAAADDERFEIWTGLWQHLPLLAEGAPDAFLDGVRRGAARDNPQLSQMFRDGEGYDPMFSSSPHTGLLWALEVVAWSSEHFAQVIYLLARLAEIDPGGRLVNRPSNSLRSILCPWHPETTANNAGRLRVVDELRRRHGDTAWPLMLDLLPEPHALHHPTSSPRFRDWKPPSPTVTTGQWFEFVAALIERLMDDADDDPARWRALLGRYDDLAPTDRSSIRTDFSRRVDAGELRGESRDELWEAVRTLVAQHREHSESDWALPAEELDILATIAERLTPGGAVEAQAWVFEDHMPDLGDASKLKDGEYDHDGYTAALDARRRLAASEVLANDGWPGILRLAARSVVPWSLGTALIGVDHGQHEAECLALLGSTEVHLLELATGYLVRCFAAAGWKWLDPLLTDAGFSSIQQARLLVMTHEHPASWHRADELGADVARDFWKLFSPYGLGGSYPHADATARRLVGASRPAAALQVLTLCTLREKDADPSLASTMADVLDDLFEHQATDQEMGRLREYDFTQAIGFLERHREVVGVNRLGLLEWRYLGALGHKPDVPSLHGALAEDPSFFVEILSAIYRPHSGPDPDPDAARQQLAANAYRLLSSWTTPPGTQEDGSVDGGALRAWIDEALPLLDVADRRIVGELHVGHILASAPADPDGAWPCAAVRDLLEDLELERIEEGLQTQIFNNRGITSRAPEDGGDQERVLAEQYLQSAQRFGHRWPRTASVMRSLASTYTTDARREDAEAERRRAGLER